MAVPLFFLASVLSTQEVVPVQGEPALVVGILGGHHRAIDLCFGVGIPLLVCVPGVPKAGQFRDGTRGGSLYGKHIVDVPVLLCPEHSGVVFVDIVPRGLDARRLGLPGRKGLAVGKEGPGEQQKGGLHFARHASDAELGDERLDHPEGVPDLEQVLAVGGGAAGREGRRLRRRQRRGGGVPQAAAPFSLQQGLALVPPAGVPGLPERAPPTVAKHKGVEAYVRVQVPAEAADGVPKEQLPLDGHAAGTPARSPRSLARRELDRQAPGKVDPGPGQEADPVEPGDGPVADKAPQGLGVLVSDLQSQPERGLACQVVGQLRGPGAHGSHHEHPAGVGLAHGRAQQCRGHPAARGGQRQPFGPLEEDKEVGVAEAVGQKDEGRDQEEDCELTGSVLRCGGRGRTGSIRIRLRIRVWISLRVLRCTIARCLLLGTAPVAFPSPLTHPVWLRLGLWSGTVHARRRLVSLVVGGSLNEIVS
ncbi:unnamed protein product [Pseudo-nitzschia multistriata]|uniref:Uncharacterized protein n=1 Tax=Pseudo-nitzschia multistriata TaxID=183589 RepID=A0A448Z373_9STRA|nr:unnamed protein product [Pseudo-nitzschia multistriata]